MVDGLTVLLVKHVTGHTDVFRPPQDYVDNPDGWIDTIAEKVLSFVMLEFPESEIEEACSSYNENEAPEPDLRPMFCICGRG